jgi:hypothetical protein
MPGLVNTFALIAVLATAVIQGTMAGGKGRGFVGGPAAIPIAPAVYPIQVAAVQAKPAVASFQVPVMPVMPSIQMQGGPSKKGVYGRRKQPFVLL